MLYRRLPGKKPEDETSAQHLRYYTNRSTLTLIVKAIDSINRSAFMISTQQEKVLWIFDLVG